MYLLVTHKVSPTWPPKCDAKRRAPVGMPNKWENPTWPQPYTERNRKAGSRRGGLPQGRTHQLVVQGQVVSPEDIHISNIWTQQVLFRNVYACTHVHTGIIGEEEALKVKENWEGEREGLEGTRRREKCG